MNAIVKFFKKLFNLLFRKKQKTRKLESFRFG